MNKIYFNYFLKLLLKNKILWVLLAVNFAVSIIPDIIIFTLNSDIEITSIKYSLLLIGLPNVFLMFTVAISIIILISNTKNNNVDLYLYIKPISRYKITLIKQLAIFAFSLHLILFQLIILIVRMSMGMEIGQSFIMLIATMASLLIMSFIWISLFSLIGIYLKAGISSIIILSTTFLLLISAIIPTILINRNQVQEKYDPALNKNNIIRALDVDSNGFVVSSTNAIYQNPLAQNNNKIILSQQNDFNSYSPFSALFGFSPLIVNSYFETKDVSRLADEDLLLSSINLKTGSSDFVQLSNYSNIVFAPLSTRTAFDIKDKSELYELILNELLSVDYIRQNKVNASAWSSLENTWRSNLVWNNLSSDDHLLISSVLGLNKADSLLWDVFRYGELLKNKIDLLFDFIENKVSKEFASFIKFLLQDNVTKQNVFSFQSIIPVDKINSIHPNIETFDELKRANEYDLDFIKSKLMNISTDASGKITKVQYLDKNNVYQEFADFNQKYPQIVNISDWNKYIDDNSTLNNLRLLIQQLKSNAPSIAELSLRGNTQDFMIISEKITFDSYSKFSLSWVYLILLASGAGGMQYLQYRKMTRKDLI